MENNKTMPWGKIVAWSIGIHLILISISILEVVVYSLLINPGNSEAFYTEHAQMTAPIVAVVFGIVFFFIITKRLAKNYFGLGMKIALWLTLAYIVVDIAMLVASDVDIFADMGMFALSFGTKALAGVAGAYMVKKA